MATAPLAGIRVLDFSRVIAGPYLTLCLADLGAEIVKVEEPGSGDDMRSYRPPDRGGEGAGFMALNRNKRSLALDIGHPEGRRIARELASGADILVENFRADVMQRQGLDYATLSALNPRLIYCSITGYGHASPFRLVAGYDQVAQAEAGLMYLTGDPAGPPVRAGASVSDTLTGLHAGVAVLAALRARAHTGKGQFIDVALFDCVLSTLSYLGQGALLTGRDPQRTGNDSPLVCPTGLFQCRGGAVMMTCGNDRQFARLCRDVLDRPALADDPRYRTNADRLANRDPLLALLREAFGKLERDAVVAALRRAGVPGGALRRPSEAIRSPEAAARAMVRPIDHPRLGRIDTVGTPFKLSDTPAVPPVHAPALGEHTEEVLAGVLGLDADEIGALRAAGAIPGG